MDNVRNLKLNNEIIKTQESDEFNSNFIKKSDFRSKVNDKFKNINIKSNQEIYFGSEKSFYSTLEKQFTKNYSNEQENIDYDPNEKIKELLLDNKTLLQGAIMMKEKLSSQEAKISKLIGKEQLYKNQISVNSVKIEQCDIYQNQLKERENYINELISRYNALEKEYQQIVSNKNSEIKDLHNKINLEVLKNENLQNQVNYITENLSNNTKDLMKSINILEEKNMELENKLSQIESFYEKEIDNLNKQLQMNEMPTHEHNLNINTNPNLIESKTIINNKYNNKILRNSAETVLEMKGDHQNNFQKAGNLCNESNENQVNSKQNEDTNLEIMKLKQQNEKLSNDLKIEKEKNRHQISEYDDNNYFISQDLITLNKSKENSKKIEDTELIRKKLWETESYLLEMIDNNQYLTNNLNKLKERNIVLDNENKFLNEHLNTNMKSVKIDRFDIKSQELIERVPDISNFNSMISRISLGNQMMDEKPEENNIPSNNVDKNTDFMESEKKNLHLYSNENVYSKKRFKSFQAHSNLIKLDKKRNKGLSIFKNDILSNYLKDNLIITKSEIIEFIEPGKLREDNVFLKDQNFKYIAELQKQTDHINNLKIKVNYYENEKQELETEKAEIDKNFQLLQNELSQKNIKNNTIDEFKRKLNSFSEINSKLNENFIKLEETVKFQNQKIIEKNTIINERHEIIENLINEKQILINEKKTFSETLREYEKELETKRKTYNLDSKVEELNDELKNLKSENKSIIEKLKKKKKTIKELYDEIMQKDIRLKTLLLEKNEKNVKLLEENDKFKNELIKIKQDLENLVKENKRFKTELTEKKVDISKINESKNEITENSLPCYRNKRKNMNYNPNNLNEIDIDSQITDEILNVQNYFLINKDQEKFMNKKNEELIDNENFILKIKEASLENMKLQETIKKLEETIHKQSEELSQLKAHSNYFNSFQKNINEINQNQEKVNQFLLEFYNIKEENKIKIHSLENINDEMSQKLYKALDDLKCMKIESNDLINTLKHENLNLITELKKKDMEIENRKIENNILSNKYNKEEISKIREDYQSNVFDLTEKYERILDKTNKNKTRLEMLRIIQKNHLNFITDRFKQHITELIHTINSLKLGNKCNSDNLSINERLSKNIETFTSLLYDISQREATIDYYKNEIKSLKNKITNLNSQVKNLIIENNDLKEEKKIKKLQQKISHSKDDNEENDILKKIKDYALITQEISSIKQKETKLKIKIESKNSEIKLLKCQIDNLKDQVKGMDLNITSKDVEINLKEKQNNEIKKSNKIEMSSMIDELSRIKEKWVSPEIYSQKLETVSNLERIIKSLKEDIQRKKDLINHYKNGGNNEEMNNKIINLQEKIKEINVEIINKDSTIKLMMHQIEELDFFKRNLITENSTLHNQLHSFRSDINFRENLGKLTKVDQIETNITNIRNIELINKCENITNSNEQLKIQFEEKRMTLLFKEEENEKIIHILKNIYDDLISQYKFIYHKISANDEAIIMNREWREVSNMIKNTEIRDIYKIADLFIQLKETILLGYNINDKKTKILKSNQNNYGENNNSSFREFFISNIDKNKI